MTDPDRLAQIGKAIYHGNYWQSPMAEDLGVNPRTFRRWLSGEMDIPPGVWPQLKALCKTRIAGIKEALTVL